MADLGDEELSRTRKGNRWSAQARANQAARLSLVTEITERRQQLDQSFFEYIRELRRVHGNHIVDRAFSLVRRERERVSAVPKEHGPRLFRKLG